jgi:hypothetical protein
MVIQASVIIFNGYVMNENLEKSSFYEHLDITLVNYGCKILTILGHASIGHKVDELLAACKYN